MNKVKLFLIILSFITLISTIGCTPKAESTVPVTSQCQAVDLAKENIPNSIIPKITANGADTNSDGQWFVDFVFLDKNNLVNRDELTGKNFQIDEGNTFNLIIVLINKQTGTIVKKTATNGVVPGSPTFWVDCDN